MINEMLQEIAADIKQIYRRLDDIELTGFQDNAGLVPAAGTAYNHLEDDGANWTSVTDLNMNDDAFLYFGVNQDTSMVYDEAVDDLFKVDGADWLVENLILNISEVGGGGESLALRTDQNAITAFEVVNNNNAAAAAALGRFKNVAGAGGNDALSVGVLGTGYTPSAPLIYADSGLIQAGVNLSGGLTIRTIGAHNIYCGVNSTTEIWRATTGGFTVNEQGADLDTRVESDNQAYMLFVDGGNDVVGIRSSVPAGSAEGLHVPWITGDADATAVFGSANASNDQNAIEAFTDSGYGVQAISTDLVGVQGSSTGGTGVEGISTSGAGGSFRSTTGLGLSVNLTGAGTAIADFNDNGTSVLTIQDGGQSDFAEYIRHLADTDTSMRFQTDQWTLSCGGVTMIDAVEAASDYLNLHAGLVGINETSNANMTIGLTIDQAANDDEIVNLRSSDVGAVLSTVETGTFGTAIKAQATSGGLSFQGFKDSDGVAAVAIQLDGHLAENADTTKSTSALGIIDLRGRQTDGTNLDNIVADGNIATIRTRSGGSNITRFIFDAEGTGHADVSWVTFSDKRLKQNIQSLDYGLDELLNLRPVRYLRYEKSRIGLLAQDVEPFVPEATRKPPTVDSVWCLDYNALVPVLIKAVQEMNIKLEKLKNDNNTT